MLDKVGCMIKADVALMMGRYSKPGIMAGNERQLSPTMMNQPSRDVKDDYLDVLSLKGKVSFLELMKKTGFPTLVLNT